MKLSVMSNHLLYPGQMIEVDLENYIVESIEPDYSAPRRMMEMAGGPYGEPLAVPSIHILTLRPITEAEEEERRRQYDAEHKKPERKWWQILSSRKWGAANGG